MSYDYRILSHIEGAMSRSNNKQSGGCCLFAGLRCLLLPVVFFAMQQAGLSQVDSSAREQTVYDSIEIKYDSAKTKLFSHIKQSGDSEQTGNRREYDEDTIATRQNETIQLIKKLTLEVRAYLDNGIDTTGLSEELTKVEYWYGITSDGVFVNRGTMQTHRNLETSY